MAGETGTAGGGGTTWAADWARRGSCLTIDPEELFVQGAAQKKAKQVCQGCPVRVECLADALDNRVNFGVWGGMTERERRALLRRRPNVSSWRRLFETALTEQAQQAQQGGQAGAGRTDRPAAQAVVAVVAAAS